MPAFTQLAELFRNRTFAFYQAGQAPSLLAGWMQRIGVGWLAWELTQSPTWVALVAAADLAPTMVIAPIAGAFADRWGPLRQARIAQAIEVLQSGALVTALALGILGIELLFALTLVLGMVHPFASSARFSVLPAIVGRPYYATAISVDSALFQGSRFVGPAIAALMLPATGVIGVFVVSTLGLAAFLISLSIVRMGPPAANSRGRRGLLSDIREGLSYARTHAGIFPLFCILAVISICGRPIQDLLPAFAGGVFEAGAVGLAWLTAALGIGATISAVVIAAGASTTVQGVILACIGFGLSLLGFVATDTVWVAFCFCVLVGFSMNSMSTRIQALIQGTVEDHIRSRVMSLYMLIFRGTPALGAVVYGLAANLVGLRLSFAIGAAACIAAGAIALSRRDAIAKALR